MKHIILSIALIIILYSCKREDQILTDEDPNLSENTLTPIFQFPSEELGNSIVEGIVTNDIGDPLQFVDVHFGQHIVTTNEKGYYRIDLVKEGENKNLYFTKDNYMMAHANVDVQNGKVTREDVALYPVEVNTKADSRGKMIQYDDFEIIIPEGAFKDEVDIKIAAHRTSDPEFLESFPGEFSGIRTDGNISSVESFGFIDVEIIKDGHYVDPATPVTIKILVPENSPETMPMWYFDYKTGKWIEDGVGRIEGDFLVAELYSLELGPANRA